MGAEDAKGTRSKKGESLNMGGKIASVRDLEVYKAAFGAAMEIFPLSKTFQQRRGTL